jgi:Phage capsid protein
MADPTGATAQSLYVPGFRANLNLLPQQTRSRLLEAVDSDLAYDTPGQYFNADDVGTSDPQLVTTRVPDSPSGFVDMYRRFGSFLPYADGRFIDNEDLVRQLEDPTSKVMQSMLAGLGRNRDVVILGQPGAGGAGGIFGPYQYQNAAGAYASGPANTNVILSTYAGAHEDETIADVEGGDGAYGLTIGKLIQAKITLDNAEIDEPMPGDRPTDYHIAVTANQLGDLLRSVPATSSFYSDVKALIAGTLSYFMGFHFHRLPANAQFNPIPKTGYTRQCVAWVKRAIVYRGRTIIPEEVVKRADKSFRWYAYYEFNHGCVRRYDGGVVEIDCSTLDQTPFT